MVIGTEGGGEMTAHSIRHSVYRIYIHMQEIYGP